MKQSEKRNWFQSYLSKEISIDYKACAYFLCILAFYCVYLMLQGIYKVSILYLAEIFVSTYVIGYIQVYLFWNFDEADHLGTKEILGMLLSVGMYTLAGFFLGWFEKEWDWFAIYLIFIFLSIFTVNYMKRKLDTKELNQMLKGFKEGRE